MATATVTSKGQITIPKEIRDHLHLTAGQEVTFFIEKGGVVMMRPKKDVRSLRGILHSPNQKVVSVDEMNEAIKRGATEAYERSIR